LTQALRRLPGWANQAFASLPHPAAPLEGAATDESPNTALYGEQLMPAQEDKVTHDEMANAIRALAMDAVEKAKSGHAGLPMGAADIATVLFTKVLKHDVAAANWPDRDRFVLSAGHGCMLLYALLYLTGEPSMTIAELQRFRQLGSRTPGHPE
jgi:transketolase N-terminal domain/subunit